MAALDHPDVSCLATRDIKGYIRASIPAERDIVIWDMLENVKQSGQIPRLTELLSPYGASTILRAFAVRMAALAVRRADPQPLRIGLLAAGIASQKSIDSRDDLGALAPLWRTARILQLDPVVEFREAAAIFPLPAQIFADWIARPPALQGVSSMGYLESTDEDGFRYLFADEVYRARAQEQLNPIIKFLFFRRRSR